MIAVQMTQAASKPDLLQPSKAVPLLEIADLTLKFGTKRVLQSVNLAILPGQTLAVVGESGSGKSMTALSILRLIPPTGTIERGTITFGGRDLLQLNEKHMLKVRGREIAMIFQEPMTSLNPVYTVGEQIGEVFQFHERLSRSDSIDRAIEALTSVGIADVAQRLKSYPHQFSGGMRQRVMIAMALACQPKLLLADEPTTALDVTIQAQILALLRGLQRERGLSIMLITHDLGVVAQNADAVCVMYRGRVVERAPVRAVLENPLHPYTRALLKCRPDMQNRVTRLATVADFIGSSPLPRWPVGGEIVQPWWPSDDTAVDCVLREIQPQHWVGCGIN